MQWFTGVLIYVIVWWLVWFMLLPVGNVTQDESGEGTVLGTPKSAPVKSRLGLKALATTLVAGLVTAVIVYLIQTEGLRSL